MMIKQLVNYVFGCISEWIHEFRMKHLLYKFDPAVHGEVAPACWFADPVERAKPQRQRDDFRLVASTGDGGMAYSTSWVPVGNRSFEEPVRSSGISQVSERAAALTRADLIELAQRNVSQAAAERIKPVWALNHGLTAAAIAKASGMSLRTTERAIGAFKAAERK